MYWSWKVDKWALVLVFEIRVQRADSRSTVAITTLQRLAFGAAARKPLRLPLSIPERRLFNAFAFRPRSSM